MNHYEMTITTGQKHAGELWYLHSWLEMGKTLPGDNVSNFCAVTLFADSDLKTGGQSCWARLEQPEIDLIQRINSAPYGSAAWHWFVRANHDTGSIYLGFGPDEDLVTVMDWPRIFLGSKSDNERNIAMIAECTARAARVVGIPQSASYDEYNLQQHPHLFPRCYCYYQNGGDPSKSTIGDTPKGILYMPVFDPASGFQIPLGGSGLWIPIEWLHSRV